MLLEQRQLREQLQIIRQYFEEVDTSDAARIAGRRGLSGEDNQQKEKEGESQDIRPQKISRQTYGRGSADLL